MSVQINVQASQTALAQSIAQGVAAFNSRYAGQNQLNLQINARSFSQPLGRITSDLADFESALKASNARVLAFGASTAVLGGVVRSFKEIANVTLEVEKSLTDINRVLNLSTSGLQKFSSELFNVSKQTASSFDDATKAALEFSRQGLNTEETLKRTADALTLVRLTGISSTKAVEDLTATINGFAKAGLTTSQVVNKLAAVEQDFAVSATDLTEALSRTGQAAQEAGVSFDELNALVTTAQQNTARGGAVIGNALKTIFTRLQRTETLDQLQNFNIAVRDIEGNILPAVQILKNFADRYNDLADAQRAQLSEQVAGVYQVNILKGVIKDLNNNQGTYVQALQRGAMAANEADIANQKLNKTLSALVTQTGVGLQQLANNVGKVTFAPIFEAIVSPVNDAVSYINDTLEGEGIGSIFANGLLKGVRNVIAGPGLAVAFAVIAKVAKNTFEDATKALPAILGLTTEAQKRANIEKSIISILQTQSNLSLALQGQQGNLSTQAATVLNYAKLQTAQYQQQLQIAQQLAPLLAAQNVTVGSRGIQVGPKIKAGGHIPAFAEMSERMGAAMGGYKSGKVVKAPKSVGANTYMNSAEEVKYVSGFAQPFINPPANSKAGRKHRQNAINRTGVDPYMAAKGFIPNFAELLNVSEDPYKVIDGDTIKADATIKKVSNFRLQQVDAIETNQALGINATSLAEKTFPDPKAFSKVINASGTAAYGRLSFIDDAFSKQLISQGLGVPDLRYLKDESYKQLSLDAKDKGIGLWRFKDKQNRFSHPKAIQFLNQYAYNDPTSSYFKKTKKERSAASYEAAEKGRQEFLAFSGFIPNFAPPTSAIRIPWFKKFANPAYDNIQPTLGISKASDVDTFRQTQFRSTAKNADKQGDPNIFGPLYEAFGRRALQLVNQSNIFGEFVRGSVLQPKAERDQTALDEALLQKTGIIGFDFKGFPKNNLSGGSVAKHMIDKYNRVVKTDPEQAAKIKEAIMIFNEPGNQNQLPSEFGKNFIQLAGTSYSQMLKNTPSFVKELSNETNMLLDRYVKNPAFLPMSSAKGFIPNFADFIETEIDAILQPISKSRTIQSKQLFGKTLDSAAIRYLNDTSIEKLNKYLEFDGYMEGALGIDFPDRADKKFLFTKNKGFIPNFSQLMKGYAFNDGRIYNDVYHSDAWDSIEGPTTGAIKYANYNGKLVYQAKNISEKLKQAFISRGASVSSFLPVQDVDAALRSGNTKEIQDKSSQLGAVQLSEGIKAIYENGRYTTFIKDNKSLRILGGITPDELKMYGGVDRFLAYHERVHGVQKWQSFANGFIPNFAYIKSMIARVIPNTFRSLTDTKGTAFSNTNIGIARQKSFQSYNLTDEQVLSQAQLNYPNLIMSILGNNAFIPDIDAVDKQSAGAQVYSAANIVSSFGSTTANRSDQYNPFGGGAYKGNPELIGTGSVQGKAIKLSYANVGKLGRRWENSKDPVVKDAWANLQKYAKMKLINKAKNSYTGNEGSAILNENSRSWYIDDIDKNLRKYSEILKTEYNNYLKSINRIGTYVDIKGSAEATLFGKDVNYMALRPDVLNKQLQGLPKFDWKNAANGIFYGDYKNNKEKYDRLAELKGKKWTYNNASKRMFLQSGGFIPNFAYKQSVMALEEGMSGKNAILDTTTGPFPFIRNSGQSNFASAISDHGGLKNALNDSMRNQEAAGLMSNGFVPNFAVVKARQSLGADFGSLSKTEQTLFLQLNIALTKLAKDTTLTSQQQQALQNTIQNNALMLQQSTKSINIVNDANNALVKSLQENAQAQSASAQATKAASGPRAAQQTLSTRIGGLFGGARGAVRGRQFDRMLGGLTNNVGFTLAAPMVGGFLESAIAQGKDRSEMGYGRRLASTGASAALTGLSTGAAIGSAIPGIGTAAGAAIGAIVGFSGAMISAKTTLDDLSKSIENIISRNQKDIELAKTIATLENQLASEKDPLNIELLKIKIAEAAEGIKNQDFAEAILKSSKSVTDFDNAIKEFTIRQRGLESLSRIPTLIKSFSKETGTREGAFDFIGGFKDAYESITLSSKDLEKRINKINVSLAITLRPLANEMIRLEKAVSEKDPTLKPIVDDIIKNFSKYTESGTLSDKLQPLVNAGAIVQNYADKLVDVIKTGTDNPYFKVYLKNLEFFVNAAKKSVKEEVAQSGIRTQDTESLKRIFAKINDEIQNALNEATLQLMNIEFKSNIGKLNIEKIGGIFDTAASAIGKNLESIAKSQFDALMIQIQLSREAQLADLNRTQFEETRSQEMNKYLAERKSRVSTFFEKNIAPGKESRDMASQALAKIGSDLTYDFKNLESLAYNMGVEVENARKDLIRNEEFQKKSFLTQRSNAKTLFDLEQSYAKDLRDLKKKTSEEDLKLEEIKYANLLREKQIIQSFDFANQARQIQTQAEVSRMGMGMEVNPNFFAGASRFQQEDYKFKLDRQKQEKQMAAEIRTATEQQRIVDIQRQVMSANTDATNENTKAVREYTLQLLNNRLTDVRKGLSSLESSNVSTAISKAITSEPNNTALYQTPNLAEDFRFYKYNYIPEQKASFTYDRNIIAGMDSNLQKSTEQNKPKGFFTQLYNAWTGNQKANQLPLETRSMEELIKADEEKNRITRGEIPARVINTDFQAKEYKKSDTPLMLQNLRDSNKEISVQREITLQNQKQVDLQNQEKSIVEDINSLRKARISTIKSSVASISPDQERIGLANDELTRLNKQIELNQSQLDKLQVERNQTQETERKAQLDQQILDLQEKINKGKLDELNYTEQIKNIEEARKKYAEYMASRGKFSTGVAKAMGSIKDETEMFKETLGTTTVNAFRDGLVGAMDAALNKADDLESALMGVAAGFLREIQGVMLRNIANNIVGGIGSAFSFGQPAATNQKGGLIRAQSGMYISGGRTGDKNPALLEDGEYVLNRNAVKALGGPRAIDQLNFNAFPRFATGGDPGTMSASVSMSEPFERLSMYGREQSPEYQNYLERLREEEAARERKRAERKALINSLITTAITTGVMMGLTSGVQGLKNKFGSKTPLNKVAGSKPNLAQRAQLKKAGVSIGPDGLPAMQTGGAIGFNQGGFLPYGSRLTDSIPAYLTGGEYVVNSRAVRKYGVGGLNRINSGVARFQDGGMVGDGMSPSSNSSNTSNSNISINITVNANNGKVGDQESDSTGDSSESNSKELSNRIKAVVLDVITTEQRTGGLLDSTKKR